MKLETILSISFLEIFEILKFNNWNEVNLSKIILSIFSRFRQFECKKIDSRSTIVTGIL